MDVRHRLATAACASDSERPGARLNEIVAATNWLWWLTDSAVWPRANCATADSGIIVSRPVLTAAPAEALPLPLAASAFCAALRCELLMPLAAAAAAVVRGGGRGAGRRARWWWRCRSACRPRC